LLDALTALSRKLGPYMLIEVLLPGGTLVAFTLFAVRHPAIIRKYARNARRRVARAAAALRDALRSRLGRAPFTTAIGSALRALG
ncbi:MAG TPA: hypothetical protein VHL33_08260, partial [Casimicrobiaceae bacterium]|nr:hypothetical protein [Casimicrobiaceae bacterium]